MNAAELVEAERQLQRLGIATQGSGPAVIEDQNCRLNVARFLIGRDAQIAVKVLCPCCGGHGVSMPRPKEDCGACQATGRQSVEVTLAELAAALRLVEDK